MTSITEILPVELISVIVENLAAPVLQGKNDNINYNDALKDLKACSLACRHFLPLCQSYIFNTIDLDTHNRTRSPIRRFAEMVAVSPIIGSYVQKLTVWISLHPCYNFNVYYHPGIVSSALRSLTNLQTVIITPWRDPIDWNNIPPSFTSEIYHVFQLPTITIIEVYQIRNFRLHSFAPCGKLDALTLFDSSLNEIPFDTPSTSVSVAPVRPIHLKIQGNSKEPTLLSKLMFTKFSRESSLFNFGRLETFLMTIADMGDVRAASDFLQQAKYPSLKTVNLSFPVHLDINELDALSLNSALKVVKNLEMSFICPTNGATNYLFGMCMILENLSKRNRIQVLKLYVEYFSSTSDYVNDPNWDVVNDILLALGWTSLTQVHLHITSFTDIESLPRAIARAATLKHLPRTRLKGLSSSKSFKFLWSLKSIVQDPRGFHFTADL